jgi:hypothetical protein
LLAFYELLHMFNYFDNMAKKKYSRDAHHWLRFKGAKAATVWHQPWTAAKVFAQARERAEDSDARDEQCIAHDRLSAGCSG